VFRLFSNRNPHIHSLTGKRPFNQEISQCHEMSRSEITSLWVLFAFCLAVLLQIGCAKRRTLTWETLGELQITNRHFPVSNTNNNEGTSIPSGFWNVTLRAGQNDKVYLDLRYVNGDLSLLENRKWQHFTTWPPEAIKIWEEERKKEVEAESSFSEIETLLWKENLADALYDTLRPSIKFPDTLRKSDPSDDNPSESEKEIEQKNAHRSYEKDRHESDGIEGKGDLREWYRHFCIYATDGDYAVLDWQQGGDQDIALLVYTDWAEQTISSHSLEKELGRL
jgi:hypothetical protein